MKLLKIFLILVLVLAFVLSLAALEVQGELVQDQEEQDIDYELAQQSSDEENEFSSEHGFGRFLSQKKLKKPSRMRCNKFPRICHAKGSPGPYCCKKKCVNVLIDRLNCGACGKKCKYNEICCNGKCVNPSFSRKHCGGCNKMCNNGEFCAFGLCNYA